MSFKWWTCKWEKEKCPEYGLDQWLACGCPSCSNNKALEVHRKINYVAVDRWAFRAVNLGIKNSGACAPHSMGKFIICSGYMDRVNRFISILLGDFTNLFIPFAVLADEGIKITEDTEMVVDYLFVHFNQKSDKERNVHSIGLTKLTQINKQLMECVSSG